jgi:tRNA-dihydrouridine synthase
MRRSRACSGSRGRSYVSLPYFLTKLTDYILDLVQPVPIFGDGDCYSSQDYWEKIEQSGVDGAMVARGALIKPWIFTEIKERREWDISSGERLELIRRVRKIPNKLMLVTNAHILRTSMPSMV